VSKDLQEKEVKTACITSNENVALEIVLGDISFFTARLLW
jgi:hypothetical protein